MINKIIRENLLMFFHFQQANGELLDGYVPREAFTWDDPHTYESSTAPGYIGFKNTVETDQETSLIQAIYKYISMTGDSEILDEIVAGKSVYDRLKWAIEYLYNERYSERIWIDHRGNDIRLGGCAGGRRRCGGRGRIDSLEYRCL
jgi:hypothetical protein